MYEDYCSYMTLPRIGMTNNFHMNNGNMSELIKIQKKEEIS